MDSVKTLLLLALLGIVRQCSGHSWMTCPKPYNTHAGRGGFLQPTCEPTTSDTPIITTVVHRGDRLKVGWTSNNHAGGYVRIALVKHTGSTQGPSESQFQANVLKVTCYGYDKDIGHRNYGDCIHPCGARGQCEYQSDVSDSQRYDTTIKIPFNVEVGSQYVLQWVSLVGNAGTPYYGCARLAIATDDLSVNCPSAPAPVSPPVPSCLAPASPLPSVITGGTKLGHFCFEQNALGSIDNDISVKPINVECDPRLSCSVSVGKPTCRTMPGMAALTDNTNPHQCGSQPPVSTFISVDASSGGSTGGSSGSTGGSSGGSTEGSTGGTTEGAAAPDLSVEIDAYWTGGFVGTITIKFNADHEGKWEFGAQWDKSVEVHKSWNAYHQRNAEDASGGTYTFSKRYNAAHAAGDSVEIGFYATCDDCSSANDRMPTLSAESDDSSAGGGGSSNGGVSCQTDGLRPNPESCLSFYNCANGYAWLQHCQSGLHFNPSTLQCDYPASAGCLA